MKFKSHNVQLDTAGSLWHAVVRFTFSTPRAAARCSKRCAEADGGKVTRLAGSLNLITSTKLVDNTLKDTQEYLFAQDKQVRCYAATGFTHVPQRYLHSSMLGKAKIVGWNSKKH